MDSVQVNELKQSYYEYIVKIPDGLRMIINFLFADEKEQAFNGIANLAEGLDFLLKIEKALKQYNIHSNSRINEAMEIYNDINNSLIIKDYVLLKDLIEYELIPIFSSASEWGFQEEVK